MHCPCFPHLISNAILAQLIELLMRALHIVAIVYCENLAAQSVYILYL